MSENAEESKQESLSLPPSKRHRLNICPKEQSIDDLPDEVLVMIINHVKRNCGVQKFISSIAAVSQRFRRLAMKGHLWNSSDFSSESKDCIHWIMKNIDLDSVCFDKVLRLRNLKRYSLGEITAIFDTLGKHVRSLSSYTADIGGGPKSYLRVFPLCRVIMMERCTFLLALDIYEIYMSELVSCLASLPKLVDLKAHGLCKIPEKEGILKLVDALDLNCTGLTSLDVCTRSRVLFLSHPLDKLKSLRNLKISGYFRMQSEFFAHLPPLIRVDVDVQV
mmetsp:Transcript_46087/g.75190  ORF Transcript_46087/g.75190 Transcript_46087/m.75190 type:complete len:277 (+) Transcript_46087:85-915(+)